MVFNVVVYGFDNSGKSTLCKSLAQSFREKAILSKYVKSLGPVGKSKQLEFMVKNLLNSCSAPCIQIFDRFPIIEEKVYGPILRGKDEFSNPEDQGIVKVIMDKIDAFIYCDPGYENILKWGQREQMQGVKEFSKNLYEGYKTISEKFSIQNKLIHYDYTKDDYLELFLNLYKNCCYTQCYYQDWMLGGC